MRRRGGQFAALYLQACCLHNQLGSRTRVSEFLDELIADDLSEANITPLWFPCGEYQHVDEILQLLID
jgi:hypothetical protein